MNFLKIVFLCFLTFGLIQNVSAKRKKKQKASKTIVLPSGIIYTNIVKGTGKIKPIVDDNILMHIRAYVSDSMLFDSYKLNNDEPVPAKIIKPQFNGDIMEAFTYMVEGDSVVMKVHQDSLFRNGMKPPYAIPGDMVMYQIKMVSVKPKAEYEKEQKEALQKSIAIDAEKIQTYLAEKKIMGAQKTESGLYYQVLKPGTGAQAEVGKEVTMNYTGYLLDGTIFDSNEKPEFNHVTPFKFKLGKGSVIKGWDEGVAMMKKGEKRKLIIPSALAYGNQPRPGLPANSVLVFDVELVD
jgi:FKBP-type peptidyl-prolyl cis-trans isomerase FkpA